MLKILNSSPDVLVLEEAELFWNALAADFAEYYNRRAVHTKSEVTKGFYLPARLLAGLRGDAILPALGRYFRLTGDKVALMPKRAEYVHVFRFLTETHLDAFHIFTIRRPDAAVLSMHKLFPEMHGSDLIRLWIDSLSLTMCCLSLIPRACVVPRERLSPEVLQKLAEFLGVELIIASQSLRPDRPPPTAAELSWMGQQQANELQRCNEIYDGLMACYSTATLTFLDPHNAYELPWQVIPALREIVPDHQLLVDRIWEDTTAENDVRRAMVDVALNKGKISVEERALIVEFLRDYPQDGFAHYAMGFAFLQEEDCRAAIREFSIALECGFFEFWVRYNRAVAYERAKDIDNALADAERAVSLNPDHEGVRRHLARLRNLQNAEG